MGIHNYLRLFLLVVVLSNTCAAQTPYIIYLKNKQGTSYSLSNPSGYLSSRSIERRTLQNIAIDSTDLPVSEQYLAQIRSAGASVIYTSRWMNAAYVKADAAQYTQILNLPFVVSGMSSFRTTDSIQNTQAATASSYSDPYSDFMGITQMHQQGFDGNGILIAITDSGFPGVDTLSAFSHLWNQNKVIYHWDIADNSPNVFDDDAHGTSVCSILGAVLPDYTGVASQAAYILLRSEVAASESMLEEFHWLRAAEIADSCGADIISNSLGYTTYDNPSASYSYADMDGKTSIIAMAADKAFDKGILVVSSAGNDGNLPWKYIGTPADAINVLAIGSVDTDYKKSTFSSVGPSADGRIKPDLCARGSGIPSLKPDGTIHAAGGTSFATPMVAGMAAGLKEEFPSLTTKELRQILIQAGDQYLSPDNEKGYGLLQYKKMSSIAHIYHQDASVILAPNPYDSGDLFLKLAIPSDIIYINVCDLHGSKVYTLSINAPNAVIQLQDQFRTLTAGLYFLSIQTDTGNQVIKWIKL